LRQLLKAPALTLTIDHIIYQGDQGAFAKALRNKKALALAA
jgi:hypothetical protein